VNYKNRVGRMPKPFQKEEGKDSLLNRRAVELKKIQKRSSAPSFSKKKGRDWRGSLMNARKREVVMTLFFDSFVFYIEGRS